MPAFPVTCRNHRGLPYITWANAPQLDMRPPPHATEIRVVHPNVHEGEHRFCAAKFTSLKEHAWFLATSLHVLGTCGNRMNVHVTPVQN